MKKIIALFVLLSLMISCSKEAVKTPGQVAADQINAALSGSNITQVTIYEWRGSFYTASFSDVKFQISGQFVIVTLATTGSIPGSYKYYYNLDNLAKFFVTTGGPPNRLELYFN